MSIMGKMPTVAH